MKTTIIMAAALLSGCASLQQPPTTWQTIHMDAKARVTYQNYAKRDWRYIRPGTTGAGNCAVFAFTTYLDAVKAGLQPERIHVCRLPDGTGHAFTRVDGWDSDVRFKRLIPAADQDCK